MVYTLSLKLPAVTRMLTNELTHKHTSDPNILSLQQETNHNHQSDNDHYQSTPGDKQTMQRIRLAVNRE